MNINFGPFGTVLTPIFSKFSPPAGDLEAVVVSNPPPGVRLRLRVRLRHRLRLRLRQPVV